ncbi:hypothetical protein [Xanthobacter tagetidis]|uniref:EthD domain-containing protein n=1 Tax=Xanthobacter tagetidis TaxID=60216 RepID=A0A3L7AAH3_9HYPH|nr:hypothetical protein [Xanthobacter tagetidis]MBB6309650.1 hypothetical protein [Xanthobacter tagetidis]RLP77197.1 hypothetical protein D9R14_14440 [Xanthobacter tagetidis]
MTEAGPLSGPFALYWECASEAPAAFPDALAGASARRYAAAEGALGLVIAELDAAGAGSGAGLLLPPAPADLSRHLLREVSRTLRPGLDAGAALDAPVVNSIWFDVPPEGEDEFDAWYDTEHIPLLMRSPDWMMVRRFSVLARLPFPATRLSLHYIAREEALASPERQAARATPWRDFLALRDWFKPRTRVFRRL